MENQNEIVGNYNNGEISNNNKPSLIFQPLHQLKLIKNILMRHRNTNHNDWSLLSKFHWLKIRLKKSFLILVVMPWLFISIYLIFIKTPEYKSTLSVFLGQKTGASTNELSGLKAIFNKGKQMVTSAETAAVLLTQKYIYSAHMLNALQNSVDIKGYYQSKSIDIWSRLKQNPNQQEFLTYYLKKVKVISDPTTGELIISVNAFSPEKAQTLLKVIAKNATQYLNKITTASLMEQTKLASSSLETSRTHLIQTKIALNELIHKNKTSPLKNSEILAAKELELKFAQTEYEATLQAYVISNLATHHNKPIITAKESLPDYIDSPNLPNDLISAIFMLMIGYFLGHMILVIIREHID